MTDEAIIELLMHSRDDGIRALADQYEKLLIHIVVGILGGRPQDVEECVNDTYLDAWNAMPTERPTYLGAFLSKIVRRVSIDRFRHDHRLRRGGFGSVTEELTECIPDTSPGPAEELEAGRLREALDNYLGRLPRERRVMFVLRYFYAMPVSDIAARMGLSESNVKVSLHRVRQGLRAFLEKEELL